MYILSLLILEYVLHEDYVTAEQVHDNKSTAPQWNPDLDSTTRNRVPNIYVFYFRLQIYLENTQILWKGSTIFWSAARELVISLE